MNTRFALLLTMTALALLAACQSAPESPLYTAKFGDNLVAAGFAVKTATTPQQVAMLARLPQHRFVSRFKSDVVRYVYADSALCGCMYLGDQSALNRFRNNRMAQRLYNQEQLAAIAYEDAQWDWGAWGSWGENYNFAFGPGW